MREVAQAQLRSGGTLAKGRSIFMGLSAKPSVPMEEHMLKESSGIRSRVLSSCQHNVPLLFFHARTSVAATLES